MKSEEESISAGQLDGTAAPRGHGSALAGSRHQQAAIVIATRDGSDQETLSRELSGRYGLDYQIVVCAEPADLESQIEKLLLSGTPVAMVIGGVGEADPDGIELLAKIRAIDPTVSRVAAVRWGEWDTARPIFDAITMGKLDHWVTRPWHRYGPGN